MKISIIFLALFVAITVFPGCKKSPEQELAVTVHFSVGNARIVSAGGEKAAVSGDSISFNDTIVTGAASIVDLNFGSKGIIRIVENSSVRMAQIQPSPGTSQVQFDMEKGKIVVIMSKLSRATDFSVRTPTTIAAIRGTSFMVVSDPGSSKIYVLKGRILVQLAREGKLAGNIEKMLEANKKVVVSEDLVNQIVAGKKDIEVVSLNPKEISDIKKEIKDIKASDKLDAEAQKEFAEILRDADEKPGAAKKGRTEPQNQDIQSIPSI
ncbi:MAG TPA: FecR family protein [Spirochaetota bacterium]|nr:FecR domain-containing protein [Spirochaetota bacterium]HOD16541.1 FecR family protein [Spirochaetota bacterium]HPI87562.1 FecR family protein [Bacteroidales bacterium]HPN13035.1 FecR family protein [Spirochaetota bacterium]